MYKVYFFVFQPVISCYLGIAILIVGWIKILAIESGLPKIPTEPRIWLISLLIGILGVAQQFCLICKFDFSLFCFIKLPKSLRKSQLSEKKSFETLN